MTGYTQNRRAIMVPIPRPLLLVETHWAEPISDWVAALRAAGRAETTIRTRTEHLRWLARDLPATEPWDITLDDLNRWCGTHAWARETRRSVRASLRSFYGWGPRERPLLEEHRRRPVPHRPSPAATPPRT